MDEYAQIDNALETFWNAWKDAENKYIELRENAKASAEQEDYLRQSLEDLDALEPQPGEEETLSDLRESLMHREQILEALNTAYHILNGDSDPIREAWSALDRVADKIGEKANDAIGALDRASAEMSEALSAIQSLSNDLEHSEHNLETIDDRLFGLRPKPESIIVKSISSQM